MGFFDKIQSDFKEFIHSITTDDHYASFDSRFAHSNADQRPLTAALNGSASNNALSTSLNTPYRPGLRSQLVHNGSDVQLQDYAAGEAPLPTIESVWDRLDKWLEEEYPELGDNIQDGASPADLNEFENDLRCTLPLDVRQSYLIHDGQVRGGQPTGALMGLTFLDLEGIFEEARIWERVVERIQSDNSNGSDALGSSSKAQDARKQVDFRAHQTSVPAGHIQEVYAHAGWIPLAKDWAGNNVAVDLAPGPEGRWGQIILFGREFDRKVVVARSWTEFLYHLVEDLEDGNYIIDDEDESLWYKFRNRAVGYLEVLTKRAVGKNREAETEGVAVQKGVKSSSELRQAAMVAGANSRLEMELPKTPLMGEGEFKRNVSDVSKPLPVPVVKPLFEQSDISTKESVSLIDAIEVPVEAAVDVPVKEETVAIEEEEKKVVVQEEKKVVVEEEKKVVVEEKMATPVVKTETPKKSKKAKAKAKKEAMQAAEDAPVVVADDLDSLDLDLAENAKQLEEIAL